MDQTLLKELDAHDPLRAGFHDAGCKDSLVGINVEQIFRLLSPATELKHL